MTRHDNLVGVFEALICSIFWFNPLVWLAHRGIGITREAACDERVAESAIGAGTYASALAKFCQSLIAPRVAGVSCMASAHLKERMEHLMNYESLRTRALSHRAISTLAASFVLLFIVAAGMLTAQPAQSAPADPEVTGTVTVDFKDVPWDQAFELILRQNGLTYQMVEKGGMQIVKVH